jgi:hypothetical protein
MNKSIIALFLLALGATAAQAQTSSGSMMVGGGFEFTSVSYQAGSANDENRVSFTPSFGYFVSDNFAVGASLTLGSEREGTGAGKTVRSSFGLGPFARYYIFTSNEKFGFFGQAQLAFSSTKTDPPVGNVLRGNAISFALSPGVAFFFNEHWAAEFAFRGFVFTSTDPNKNTDNDKYNVVQLGLNSFTPSLGFRYHF